MAARYPIPHLISPAAPSEGGVVMHRTEMTIKGSLFLCSTGHADSIEGARAFVESIKKEFADATHNCWAFAVGPPKDTARVGFSDDGEPHGTAGRPMLTALHHSGIGELVCVVTRYFGGIKLGTGGLVRAYQGAVLDNLQSLPTKERITPVYIHVVLEYSQIILFRRLLPTFEAEVMEEEFGVDAAFTLRLPEEHLAALTESLVELTDGNVLIDVVGVE